MESEPGSVRPEHQHHQHTLIHAAHNTVNAVPVPALCVVPGPVIIVLNFTIQQHILVTTKYRKLHICLDWKSSCLLFAQLAWVSNKFYNRHLILETDH